MQLLTEPKIEDRAEQPYAAIRASITMKDFGDVIVKSHSDVYARLEALGVEPTGAPFVRYNVIDMEGQLEIEVGVPVAAEIPGDGRVVAGILPSGRYGSLTHVGDYDGLVDANEVLQQWAREKGLRWAMSETEDGDRFESRFEVPTRGTNPTPRSGRRKSRISWPTPERRPP